MSDAAASAAKAAERRGLDVERLNALLKVAHPRRLHVRDGLPAQTLIFTSFRDARHRSPLLGGGAGQGRRSIAVTGFRQSLSSGTDRGSCLLTS
jgi:hypothetical protein